MHRAPYICIFEFIEVLKNPTYLLIIGAEVFSDWLKHVFILQINTENRVKYYISFRSRMALDMNNNRQNVKTFKIVYCAHIFFVII